MIYRYEKKTIDEVLCELDDLYTDLFMHNKPETVNEHLNEVRKLLKDHE